MFRTMKRSLAALHWRLYGTPMLIAPMLAGGIAVDSFPTYKMFAWMLRRRKISMLR